MDRAQLLTAIRRLAGTERLVIYDVPEDQAPVRPNAMSPFVRGSAPWWDFVDRRRALDDGNDLTLLVSLRGLRAEERMLVVNWGTAYANAFLLIEPADPWLDLSTDAGIRSAVAQTASSGDADAFARAAYAEWVYWYAPPGEDLESHYATLELAETGRTLWEEVGDRLPRLFPESVFLSSLTLLNLRESELFTGGRPVYRAIVPFLTRLGLPILYDARHVIRGVRQLVDAGLAWVQDPQDNWRVYQGPQEPVPAELPDDRFANMVR